MIRKLVRHVLGGICLDLSLFVFRNKMRVLSVNRRRRQVAKKYLCPEYMSYGKHRLYVDVCLFFIIVNAGSKMYVIHPDVAVSQSFIHWR